MNNKIKITNEIEFNEYFKDLITTIFDARQKEDILVFANGQQFKISTKVKTVSEQ